MARGVNGKVRRVVWCGGGLGAHGEVRRVAWCGVVCVCVCVCVCVGRGSVRGRVRMLVGRVGRDIMVADGVTSGSMSISSCR